MLETLVTRSSNSPTCTLGSNCLDCEVGAIVSQKIFHTHTIITITRTTIGLHKRVLLMSTLTIVVLRLLCIP